MKKYESPEIEILKLDIEDIISASSLPQADIDGGSVGFKENWLNVNLKL